jgi:hypothetical protein
MFDVFHLDLPIRVSYTLMCKLREVVASHTYAIDDPSVIARWSKFVAALEETKKSEYAEGRYSDTILVRINVHTRSPSQLSDNNAHDEGDEEEDEEEGGEEGEPEVVDVDSMDVDHEEGIRTRSRATTKKDADTVYIAKSTPVEKGKVKEASSSKVAKLFMPWTEGKHSIWKIPVRLLCCIHGTCLLTLFVVRSLQGSSDDVFRSRLQRQWDEIGVP